MIGALIVTHGNLAHELLNAARQIEADVSGMQAVPLEWNDTVDEAREKIREALETMTARSGVIIFTDMFGGTPSNISLSFLEEGRVEIVTGVNLPMVVKFAMLKEEEAAVGHRLRLERAGSREQSGMRVLDLGLVSPGLLQPHAA